MQVILAQANAAMRFAAMDALRFVAPDDVVAELLLPYLNDANSNVRWTICDLLFRNSDSRVILPLVRVLLEDTDSNVRLMAAEALVMIGDARAIPALEYAAAHDLGKDYEDRSIADTAREALLAIQAREQPKT
jgi:HEAT repeat protein